LFSLFRSFPYKEEIVGGGLLVQEVAAIKNLTGMMETLSKQCKVRRLFCLLFIFVTIYNLTEQVGEVSNLDLTTSKTLVQSLESGFAAVKAQLGN
jgi:hypothetical protein